MSNFKVYDKVSWHYPEGKSSDLKSALSHFIVIMAWLNMNNFLTIEGKEILELGIGPDFSLTSSMVSENGNEILSNYYTKWLKSIDTKNIDEMLEIWKHIIANSDKL